jgi:hypothetical protein
MESGGLRLRRPAALLELQVRLGSEACLLAQEAAHA